MKKTLLIIVPIIAIAVVGIALYSNRETDPLKISSLEEPKVASGKYYFDFDEVVYYKTDIDENEVIDYRFKEKQTEQERFLENVILNDFPKTINNTAFINKLEVNGFTMNTISKEKLGRINEIFREKQSEEVDEYACIHAYRDIFIFRKKSKIVGIAKNCFECDGNYILGTNADTRNFGSEGEYKKLAELVK